MLRPSLIQANQTEMQHTTEPPPVVLYNQTAVSAEEYVGRLSVSEKRVALHSVRMTDEGSFTVLDREAKVRRRNCLNVRGEERSVLLPHPLSFNGLIFQSHVHVSLLSTCWCECV